MTIHLLTDDAVVAAIYRTHGPKTKRSIARWVVRHASFDVVLASCDTEEEAKAARDAFNDLARLLRGAGHQVRYVDPCGPTAQKLADNA